MQNLDYYYTFYTVANCGSVSRAADLLLSSRPTITEHLHSLEVFLNLKLFNSNSKGIFLSNEGQQLYNDIEPLMQSFNRVEGKYHSLGHLKSGIIHICFNNYSSSKVFQYITKDFKNQHPDILLQTSIIPRTSIANVLEKNIVDFTFVSRPRPGDYTPTSKPADTIKQYKMGLFDDVIIAHRHLSSLAREKHHFKDLIRSYTFLFQRDLDEGSHGYYQNLLQDVPYAESKIVVYNDIDALFDLLKYTDTIALVPRLAFDLYPKKGDYVMVETFEPLLGTEYIIHVNTREPLGYTASKMYEYLFNYPEFSPQEMTLSL